MLIDGDPINTASLTRADLVLTHAGTGEVTTISSTNSANDVIRWSQAGYKPGELRFLLGSVSLSAGRYTGKLIIYDTNNTAGIVCDDELLLRVE